MCKTENHIYVHCYCLWYDATDVIHFSRVLRSSQNIKCVKPSINCDWQPVDLNGSLIKYAAHLIFFSYSSLSLVFPRSAFDLFSPYAMITTFFFIMTMNFKWWQAIKFLIEIYRAAHRMWCKCVNVNAPQHGKNCEMIKTLFELQKRRRMAWIELKYAWFWMEKIHRKKVVLFFFLLN